MSEDGETSEVIKGIHCGACIHLPKPIEMERLQYIYGNTCTEKDCSSNLFEFKKALLHWVVLHLTLSRNLGLFRLMNLRTNSTKLWMRLVSKVSLSSTIN